MNGPDLPAAFKWPTSRPDAWKTYVGLGFCILIPLVGPFVPLGWQKRAFEAARAGEPPPTVDLGADIVHGLRAFVALFLCILPAFIPFVVVLVPILLIAPPVEGGEPPVALIIGVSAAQLILIAFIFGLNLFFPEIERRIWRGSWAPVWNPGPSFRAIRAAPGAFLLTLVGCFAAQMAASIGMFACYVGMFVTMPWAMAVAAHLIAQWDTIAGVPE